MIPVANQDLRSPSQAQTIGMWLFLLTLAILFAAGMLGYGVVRLTSPAIPDNFHLHLPQALWLSTILVLAASYAAHRAVVSIIHNKPAISQRWMGVTTVLALGFLLVQTPSMLLLLADHAKLLSAGMPLYGLIFSLVLVHAAHVFGGFIALVITWRHALAGQYTNQNYGGVYCSALYWHFLDVIWLAMFGTMLFLG